MKISFKSRIERLDYLKLNHITVAEAQLLQFRKDSEHSSVYNQRFIITINDKVTWREGSVSLGDNKAYITISTARMKKVFAVLGDIVQVELERDDSKYGFDVPEEFEEVLNQDVEAKHQFESLTLGKQRAIIYLVIQLKSSQKRIEKSLFFMENLKRAPKGQVTMRHVLGKDLP